MQLLDVPAARVHLLALAARLAEVWEAYQPPARVRADWVEDEDDPPPPEWPPNHEDWQLCGRVQVRQGLAAYAQRLRGLSAVLEAADRVRLEPQDCQEALRSGDPDLLGDMVALCALERRVEAAAAAGWDLDLQGCLRAGNLILTRRRRPVPPRHAQFLAARTGLLDPGVHP
ncbi:hypothetical protein, partial [Streptomonospora nanhaiensis]